MYAVGMVGLVALSVARALSSGAGMTTFRALQGLAGAVLVSAIFAMVVAALSKEGLGTGLGAWVLSGVRRGFRALARWGHHGVVLLALDVLSQLARGRPRRGPLSVFLNGPRSGEAVGEEPDAYS
jgi:MFS family permease